MTPAEESQLIRESARGKKADAWLKDPMTVEVFTKVRESIHAKWAASPIEDKDGQRDLRLMLKLLDTLHEHASDVANTGELAGHQLTAIQRAKQVSKRFLNEWGVRV